MLYLKPNINIIGAPKFFDKLKCESEVKTMKKWKIRARSLAHSTLRVEGRAGAPKWD